MTKADPADAEPFARALFVAASIARDLRSGLDESLKGRAENAGPVSFADLVQCLSDPDSADGRRTLEAASRLPEIGTALATLAHRFALADLPAVAAASDGALSMREAGDFRMRVEQSLEASGPVYLIVERLVDGGEMPRLAIGLPQEGEPVMLALPQGDDGMVQLLLDADAPLLRLFGDPDSRVLLA